MTALILKLPTWAQCLCFVLLIAWAAAAMVSVVAASFIIVDAIGQLGRLHARALSVQGCQIALRDKSAYWPRRSDGLCHIEDLQATSTHNR